MPALEKRQVERALTRKLHLEVEEHNHRRYTLRISGQDIVSTDVSRGSRKYKTLGKDLVKNMASQLHVGIPDFVDLVRCPLSRDDFLNRLRDQGLLPSDS